MIKPHGSEKLHPLFIQDEKRRTELLEEKPEIKLHKHSGG